MGGVTGAESGMVVAEVRGPTERIAAVQIVSMSVVIGMAAAVEIPIGREIDP